MNPLIDLVAELIPGVLTTALLVAAIGFLGSIERGS